MKRSINIIVCLALLWSIGCSKDKTEDVALAKQSLSAGMYSSAQMKLEQITSDLPQNVEAQCLLAIVYSRLEKTQNLEAAVGKLRDLGKPAMDQLV
ncbi:MAG: hypothetical protein ACXABY_29970, partial [Candidatus Thorarchaeota archaeon]